MVAKLSFNRFLSETMNYNEKKVQQGKAKLIHTGNFLQDKDKMNFYEKFDRLQNLNKLRPDVNVNTLHAKIAFHPTDNLSDERLGQIADAYMKKIGFEGQPYLVYKHHDTAIPHMHIVSTIVQPDGERIKTHNMGKVQSEQARKEIEIAFKLEKAENHKLEKGYSLKPVDVQKVMYGEQSSKEAMKQVIRMAMENYKAGSLEEFNALLRTYNVTADRGSKDSRLRQYNGLQYKILDDKGNTIGTPIKASAFYFQPTLKNLEKKFEANKESRKADIPEIKSKIDWVLSQRPENLNAFTEALKNENIDVLARKNKDNVIYGLTYIDQDNKVVINGRDVGKQYAANAILKAFGKTEHLSKVPEQALERDNSQESRNTQQPPGQHKETTHSSQGGPAGGQENPNSPSSSESDRSSSTERRDQQIHEKKERQKDDQELPRLNLNVFQPLGDLMRYTEDIDDTPYQLKKDKRKSRRKHL